jgi:hypothetical protein
MDLFEHKKLAMKSSMRFVENRWLTTLADTNGPKSNDEKWPLRVPEELVDDTVQCRINY